MNIVKPYSSLTNFDENGNIMEFTHATGVGLLRKIEFNARVSHRSELARTSDSWDRFLRTVVMDRGDWSVVEHASATVDTVVDRGITHEWVRHRLLTFTQESTRFVNYEKKMPPSFIYPDPDNWEGYIDDAEWCETITTAERVYKSKLKAGWPPQKARSVFPNALASRILTTGNLRNWRHFLLMRTTKEAHPQMRQVTIPLLQEFQAKIPILFEDIEPNARQIDNMRKPR